MIKRLDMQKAVSKYSNLTVGSFGSHSALEIADGAKDEDFRTLVVALRDRTDMYQRRSRLFDRIIPIAKPSQMHSSKTLKQMRELETIIIPNRGLTAHLGYDGVENKLLIPIFGNRALFRAEERNAKKNQYYLLEKARIRHPHIIKDPKDINGPVMVKVQQKLRKLERAFFTAASKEDFNKKSAKLISEGKISQVGLNNATIEEYVVGVEFNLNYFYSPLSRKVEFLGADKRLQTDKHGILSMTAQQQLELKLEPQYIEIGHTPATVRESLLPTVDKIGDKFAKATKAEYPLGIIGPFTLQTTITPNFEPIVFDVSLRVPGGPILQTTSPYTKFLFGETFGVGRRIAMELKNAYYNDKLQELVT